jgi:hypothetical protein
VADPPGLEGLTERRGDEGDQCGDRDGKEVRKLVRDVAIRLDFPPPRATMLRGGAPCSQASAPPRR